MAHVLTPELADHLAGVALGHVEQEYPNKPDHVLEGAQDALTPSALHPVFHGSFDWHSCVHGYWLLARLLRRFPEGATTSRAEDLFERKLRPDKVAGELAYLARPSSAGFERPYGWAWLLMLQAELERLGVERWSRALRPLAQAFAERLSAYLPKATYPVRAGTHGNTAFALRLAADYADVAGDEPLLRLARTKAFDWYAQDADCQAWEPSGDDFLSPALMEAECMRRLSAPDEFRDWFARFLPRVARQQPSTLFRLAVASDPADGKIAHLDGLNLSRAWCWRSLAAIIEPSDPRRTPMLTAAEAGLEASLPAVAAHYMGSHWLASFALLALEGG